MQEIEEGKLAAVIGPTAMQEYEAAADYEKAGVRRFAATLQSLTDDEFVRVCESRILDSARMQRFKGMDGVHAMASACHHEANRRHEAAGHTRDCRGDTLYSKGFNRAYASQGHTPYERADCTCGQAS